MSEPASISTGIAERYATAIFEIAKENKDLAGLESGINDLAAALGESADLRDLIASPLVSRAEQENAIAAVADKMGLNAILRNTLGLMAQKRRLFVVPQLVQVLRDMLAEERGEVTADVASAKAPDQDANGKTVQNAVRALWARPRLSMRPWMKASSAVLSLKWARK